MEEPQAVMQRKCQRNLLKPKCNCSTINAKMSILSSVLLSFLVSPFTTKGVVQYTLLFYIRSNLKKMGPLQFCLPALLNIHRNHKQKVKAWHFNSTSNEVIWPKKISHSMHGSKSAILAIFQRGPGWPCNVSAALKNPSPDFKNSFCIGCR